MNKTLKMKRQPARETEQENPSQPLRAFFCPNSVVVIGASTRPGNLGKQIIESLIAQGYEGRIISVHAKGEAIPPYQAVRTIEELPQGMELALAAVSSSNIPVLVEPLSKKGIRHLIVISGGFAETGKDGERLQNELKAAGKKFGVRIIGPNAIGIFSAPGRFNSFFLKPQDISFPPAGPVGLISQSGAFLSQILDQMAQRGIGVHKAVNFGNRVDIGECDLLEDFQNDPDIRTIGIYLESVQDGPRLVDLASRVSRDKPIVIMKGGKSERGNKAAQAHSASLAGSYTVFQAACEKANLLEVQGLEEMVDALQVLDWLPPMKGDRILVVSNGGGMAVFLTDLCEKYHLNVPKPSQHLIDHLNTWLPTYYSLQNPIDLTGSGTNEQCALAVKHLLQSGEFDGLLMVLLSGTTGINREIVPQLRQHLALDGNIPILMGAYGRQLHDPIGAELIKDKIPVFPSGETAARAMHLLVQYHKKQKEHGTEGTKERPYANICIPQGWSKKFDHAPDEMELKKILQLGGIKIPLHHPLRSAEDVRTAVIRLGFPIALKVVGNEIKHKTELKGIKLNIHREDQLLNEWMALFQTFKTGIWAEQQMPPGLDLIVGAHRDPQFGPVLIFGSGGQYVEVFQDVQRLLLPATDAELAELVYKTCAGRIIKGVRGEPPLDTKSLFAFLRLVSDWMIQEPNIKTLDFNPIRLYHKDMVVLDAKGTIISNL